MATTKQDTTTTAEETAFPDGLIEAFKERVSESHGKPTLAKKDYDRLLQDYFQLSPEVHTSVVDAKRQMLGASARVAADQLLDSIGKSNDPNAETVELNMHTGVEKVRTRADARHTTRTPNTGEEHHKPRIQVTNSIPNALHTKCTDGLSDEIQQALDDRLTHL